MNNKTVQIINCETGEETLRDMTDAELKQYEADIAAGQKLKAELDAKDKAKAALFTKLGITAEEAALLLA